jgi:hypothetical protein
MALEADPFVDPSHSFLFDRTPKPAPDSPCHRRPPTLALRSFGV